MTEWWKDPDAKRWLAHVRDEMVPKLRESTIAMELVPDNEGDPKFWVELGAAIMLGKPILTVAIAGRKVPAKLRLVSDEVLELEGDLDETASAQVAEALQRMLARLS